MDERAARAVVLVRAIETADGAREIWSDADRVSAGRSAAEVVGEAASEDRFIARRAALVLERLAERYPKTRILAGVASARGWLAPLVAAIAFVAGAAGVTRIDESAIGARTGAARLLHLDCERSL